MEQIPVIDWNDLALEFLPTAHRTPRFIAWTEGMLSQNAWLYKNFWNYCYGDTVSNSYDLTITYALNQTVLTVNGVYISTINGNIGTNPDQTPSYSNTGTYIVGNSVIFGGTFENPNYFFCITAIPSPESFNPLHWQSISGSVWYKIAPSYIGAQERAQYNAQKLIFEYALNRWFRTTFKQPTALIDGTISSPYGVFYTPKSDIFITTKNVTELTFYSGETESTSCESGENSSSNFNSTETVILGTDSSYQFIVWIPTALATSLGTNYVKIVSKIVDLMAIAGTSYTVSIY